MIQVLERAFKILRLAGADPKKPVRVSDLARELGINQTTCTNIVQTLVQGGYLEPAAGSRSYILGPEPFRLTRSGTHLQDIIDTSRPYMQNLVESVDETCLLARLGRWHKIILCQVDRESPFRIRMDYLEEQDPYTTATGRLLIAHLDVRERTQLTAAHGLPGERWNDITSMEELETACAALRKMDCYTYGLPGGELIGAAAVIRRDGIVEAALGLFLRVEKFSGEHKEKIVDGIVHTATAITDNL